MIFRITADFVESVLFELNARCWIRELSASGGLAGIPQSIITGWRDIGFTHIWLMGVWRTAPASIRFSRRIFPREDVGGSPYAIAGYELDPAFGNDAALAQFRQRLSDSGLKLILDFIPNHVGLDHPWTRTHPARFIHNPDGSIAYGKDPYFPPWADTAQLDLSQADTRAALIAELLSVAGRCDGVRCDMAMLVVNEVFSRTWPSVPNMTALPEFWTVAIAAVKASHPDFLMIAEVYWEMEQRLLDLGFDFVYDKTFLDRVRAGQLAEYVSSRSPEFLRRSIPFLENHDEERIASVLSFEEHRHAAKLLLMLPGLPLIHEGQTSGACVRHSIHLHRRAPEPVGTRIAELYQNLFRARQVDRARALSLNA